MTPTSSEVTFGTTDYYLTYTVTVATGTVTNAANSGHAGTERRRRCRGPRHERQVGEFHVRGSGNTIDRINPLVGSITTTDTPTTTNAQANTPANTVHYAVTFSKLVTGVDANDFVLAAPALTGSRSSRLLRSGAAVTLQRTELLHQLHGDRERGDGQRAALWA